MVYVGMEESTLLSKISFPAPESILVDQLDALCLILSTMDAKRSPLLLPKCLGMIPLWKKTFTSEMISAPTTSQLDWKKQAEKPSGPGALSGFNSRLNNFLYCQGISSLGSEQLLEVAGYYFIVTLCATTLLRPGLAEVAVTL